MLLLTMNYILKNFVVSIINNHIDNNSYYKTIFNLHLSWILNFTTGIRSSLYFRLKAPRGQCSTERNSNLSSVAGFAEKEPLILVPRFCAKHHRPGRKQSVILQSTDQLHNEGGRSAYHPMLHADTVILLVNNTAVHIIFKCAQQLHINICLTQ